MDYVATLRFRSSVSSEDRDAALMRRAAWHYPSGIRSIAEYWPASADMPVVSIFSTEEFASIMELLLEWEDVFDIDVYPAVSAEEGIKVGAEVIGRLQRMQPQ
jgi:hypothetical protein